MRARDIMTADVISVRPDTPVGDLIQLLLERRISGVPVLDNEQLVDIVSAGDLILRERALRPRTSMAYLAQQIFEDHARLADEYRKAHGMVAEQIMSRAVVTCAPGTPVEEVANVMAERHINRLQVVEDGRLVGIVSRSDVLRATARRMVAFDVQSLAPQLTDADMQSAIVDALRREPWAEVEHLHIEVSEGCVHLGGRAESAHEKEAIELAARSIPGVLDVRNDVLVDPRVALEG